MVQMKVRSKLALFFIPTTFLTFLRVLCWALLTMPVEKYKRLVGIYKRLVGITSDFPIILPIFICFFHQFCVSSVERS